MGAQHTPGPWRACKEGDCSCGQVWSIPADHPVATVERGPWGDSWPAVRYIESRSGMAGTAVEAFMERFNYGEVPTDESEANARLIAAAPTMRSALEQIKHSIAQARVAGNDWRRELALIENLAAEALAAGDAR